MAGSRDRGATGEKRSETQEREKQREPRNDFQLHAADWLRRGGRRRYHGPEG
jgi:hypothetical protein